jgi:hypothetical protein
MGPGLPEAAMGPGLPEAAMGPGLPKAATTSQCMQHRVGDGGRSSAAATGKRPDHEDTRHLAAASTD